MDKIKQAVEEGFKAAPGSIEAIMNEAKHEVLNDVPTKAGENDQPVVSSTRGRAATGTGTRCAHAACGHGIWTVWVPVLACGGHAVRPCNLPPSPNCGAARPPCALQPAGDNDVPTKVGLLGVRWALWGQLPCRRKPGICLAVCRSRRAISLTLAPPLPPALAVCSSQIHENDLNDIQS